MKKQSTFGVPIVFVREFCFGVLLSDEFGESEYRDKKEDVGCCFWLAFGAKQLL
jgi:hypothetical protein